MTIEQIEYGSLASSTLLNNNFEDLQNQSTALSLRISANASNLQTNTSDIADLASRVSALENQ